MKSFQLAPCAARLSCALLSSTVMTLAVTLAALPVTASAEAMRDNGSANATRSSRVESSNKAIVTQLSKSILSQASLDSLGQYFAHNLIQHDPLVQNGRQAMLNAISALRQQTPARTLSVKHVLADRDMVFVQSQISATPADELSGVNRFDTYRLDHGQIVEHWLVQGQVVTRSVSGNSEFSDLYKYASPPAPLTAQRVEMNRLLVSNLSDEVFGKHNFALLDRLWAPSYIQHNPYVATGRAPLAAVLPYIAPPGSLYRVTSAIADGDLAMVCAQYQDPGSNPANEFAGSAVCDMYRVVNFELVEHWDVVQDVPPTSANGNSMFSSLYREQR